MKSIVALAVLAITSACSPDAFSLDRRSPYGLWSTERGQTVEVNRDGTYRYCDLSECSTGTATPDGKFGVLLQGFAHMPATRRLRKLSDWDVFYELSTIPSDPARKAALEFGDGGMSWDYRLKVCRGRPCRVVGRVDYDAYRFVKLKDY